jgi:hypothetical protein
MNACLTPRGVTKLGPEAAQNRLPPWSQRRPPHARRFACVAAMHWERPHQCQPSMPRALPSPHVVERPSHSQTLSHSSPHSRSLLASPAARERATQSTSAMDAELEAYCHPLPTATPFLCPNQEFNHHLQHAPCLPALSFDRLHRRRAPPAPMVVASLPWVIAGLAMPCSRVTWASSCSTTASHHRRCCRPVRVGRSPTLLCSVP